MTMTSRAMSVFVKANRIRFSAEAVDSNPNIDDMPRGSAHWKITLRCSGRQMTTYFSQGPAICQGPTAEDVLDCLASDAAGIENANGFEDWASEYGFDTDSRKAERIYKACVASRDALNRLLGEEAFKTLLWDVERM